jgi:hypothetical protein
MKKSVQVVEKKGPTKSISCRIKRKSRGNCDAAALQNAERRHPLPRQGRGRQKAAATTSRALLTNGDKWRSHAEKEKAAASRWIEVTAAAPIQGVLRADMERHENSSTQRSRSLREWHINS